MATIPQSRSTISSHVVPGGTMHTKYLTLIAGPANVRILGQGPGN
jgi:hypothetical protein